MAYSKNDCVQVTIEDIGVSGEGIGKIDGYTLFVKDTVIGDVVNVKIMKAKKNYGYARLVDIVKPSKDRVEPACAIARQCGGCQIQAMSYEAQLKYKQKLVSDNLKRIGGLTEGTDYEMCDILGMEEPFRYRNKAQYPVGEDKDGNIVMGFYAGHTHSIIPCPDDDCLLGHSDNAVILKAVKAWMEKYRVRAYDENIHKGTVRHILIRTGFHTDEIMLCLVTKKMLRKEAADGLVDVVKELNGEISASAVGDVDIDKNIGESEDNHTNDRDRHLHITSLVVNINKEETVVLLSHKKPDSVINVKVEFGEGEGKIPLDNIEKRAESYKPKERVTYKMIKEYIEAKHGFKVHTAYIAEVKRDLGLPMYDAPNAVEELKQPRKHPTPEKVEAIKDALKHFEVI